MILSPTDSTRLGREKGEGKSARDQLDAFSNQQDNSPLQQSFSLPREVDSFWYGELSVDSLQAKIDVDEGSVRAEGRREDEEKREGSVSSARIYFLLQENRWRRRHSHQSRSKDLGSKIHQHLDGFVAVVLDLEKASEEALTGSGKQTTSAQHQPPVQKLKTAR